MKISIDKEPFSKTGSHGLERLMFDSHFSVLTALVCMEANLLRFEISDLLASLMHFSVIGPLSPYFHLLEALP